MFSTHGSTPPKSARCTAGGTYLFVPLTQLRLVVLPSLPCVEHSLCLLDEVVIIDGALSVFLEEGGTGSRYRASSESVEVSTGGGVGVALVDGAVATAFRFTFLLCQRPCMDLLRALGPWLTRCEDCYRQRRTWVINLNGGAYRYLHYVLRWALRLQWVQNTARQD